MGPVDTIRKAIEIGKRDGVITFDQLNELRQIGVEAYECELCRSCHWDKEAASRSRSPAVGGRVFRDSGT